MTRTLALGALVVLLAGCDRYHSRAQGPFGKPAKDPPPPYGAISPPKPVGNQSPLNFPSGDVPPVPKDERPAAPQDPGLAPADGPAPEIDAGQFPPFRKRPEPKAPAPKTPAPNAKAAAAPAPAKSLTELKQVLATATAAWNQVDTFESTLTRRELNPQGAATNEVVLFQYRREPMAVYTRTISENGKGREVVYSTKLGDKLHIAIGAGDVKLLRAGHVLPGMSPDDPRVKEKARYSIRDAGFGKHLSKLADVVAKIEAGKVTPEALAFLGPVKREEYPYALTGMALALRPGDDPLFPQGGTRTFFFDLKEKSPSFGMPVLIIATDAADKEAEYYLFEKVKSPAGLTDADFDPARLGKGK
jgi:hypothetical protein